MHAIGEEDLRRAADVLITSGLCVTAGERFVAVGDAESQPLLTALTDAARAAGGEATSLRLDILRSQSTNHSGERPHKVLPDAVRRALLSAHASAFVASAPRAEQSMRDQLVHATAACRLRHAHMPGISPLAFVTGLALDLGTVAKHCKTVLTRAEGARKLTATSPEGTKLEVGLAKARFLPRMGQVAPAESVVFPTGTLAAFADEVSGIFVATASLGEFFGVREGVLREPVRFEITQGRVADVRCASAALLKDVETMLHVAPNSDRVGLVVLGLNAGVTEAIGDATVDQLRPGLHLVFGDPLLAPGPGWSARTSFAACQKTSDVAIDGLPVIADGAVLG